MVLLLAAPFLAHGQADWKMLKNSEYNFRLYHPPGWTVITSDTPNSNAAVMGRNGEYIGICTVGVVPTPQTSRQTQRQLNEQMDAVTMGPSEWVRAFKGAFPDIQIIETQKAKLQNQPARLVVSEMSSETLGNTTFLRTILLSTLTPGLTWKVSRATSAPSMQVARASYKFWLPTFHGILRSFIVEQ